MPCNKCGEPVKVIDSTGATTDGPFMEKHECVNGHQGYVSGDASDHPDRWNQNGEVFA